MKRAKHHILQHQIAHFLAIARCFHHSQSARHDFCARANGNGLFAKRNALSSRHNGLQARSAQPVHIHRRRFNGHARRDGCHAAGIHILRLSGHYGTQHNGFYIAAVKTGAANRFPDHNRAQLCRTKARKAAPKCANCRACARNDEDICHAKSAFLLRTKLRSALAVFSTG